MMSDSRSIPPNTQPTSLSSNFFPILALLPSIVAFPFVHKPYLPPAKHCLTSDFPARRLGHKRTSKLHPLESPFWSSAHCTRSHAHHAPQLLELRRAHACCRSPASPHENAVVDVGKTIIRKLYHPPFYIPTQGSTSTSHQRHGRESQAIRPLGRVSHQGRSHRRTTLHPPETRTLRILPTTRSQWSQRTLILRARWRIASCARADSRRLWSHNPANGLTAVEVRRLTSRS